MISLTLCQSNQPCSRICLLLKRWLLLKIVKVGNTECQNKNKFYSSFRRHPSFNVEASLGKEIATTANRGFDDVELKVEPPSQLQPGDLSDQKIVTTDLPLDTSSIKEGKPDSWIKIGTKIANILFESIQVRGLIYSNPKTRPKFWVFLQLLHRKENTWMNSQNIVICWQS